MSGFTSKGLFSVTKEPFGDWSTATKKAAAVAPQAITRHIGRVFSAVEDEVREAINESPEWPSEIADRSSFRPQAGGYELHIEDERAADLEFGRDPQRAPAALLRPMGNQMTERLGGGIREAVRRGAGI